MPSVAYDSLGFRLNGSQFTGGSHSKGRRLALAAAGFDAVLTDPSGWAPRLAALRAMGFNAVAVRAPWALHEPLPGRFDFAESRDLGRFLREAGEAGLLGIVRIGPIVGGGFASGGLPGWVGEIPGIRLREPDPLFTDRVSALWRRLLATIVPLQATEEGPASQPRPVVAIAIEDDWRSVDTAIGDAYFGTLIRFARELGVRVPILTANNCWSIHESAIECWRQADGVRRNLLELAEVEPDAPRVAILEPGDSADGAAIARTMAAVVSARGDFILEDAVGASHGAATSASGRAQIEGSVLDAAGAIRATARPMRRVLAAATSLGPVLAGCAVPSLDDLGGAAAADPEHADAPVACALAGGDGLRVSVALAPRGAGRRARAGGTRAKSGRSGKAASAGEALVHEIGDGASHAIEIGAAAGVEFFASGLDIGGVRLERSTAAIVAVVAGRMLVVSGRARSRVRLRLAGTELEATVPTDVGAPKVVKSRGIRVVVVPHALADGVAWSDAGVSFEAEDGTVHTVDLEGRPSRTVAAPRERRARAIRLGAPETIRLGAIADGSDPRFAAVAGPRALGAWGIAEGIAAYRATWRDRARRTASRRRLAFLGATTAPTAELRVSIDGGALEPLESPIVGVPMGGAHTVVAIASDFGAPAHAAGRPRGVFGPLVEVAPLAGVKVADAIVPTFDATRVGRFLHGYDARGGAATLKWTFAPRAGAVVVDLGPTTVRGVLRLNGEIVAETGAGDGRQLVHLPGELLGGMRPAAPTRRGPKPAPTRDKPLPNELLLDIEDGIADARTLARLRKQVALLAVEGEPACEWAFARLLPPASWVHAKPVKEGRPPRGDGVPAWFRHHFTLESPRALELTAWSAFAGIVLLNGVPVLRGDRTSGVDEGRKRVRSSAIAAARTRAGVNELVVLGVDGGLPELELR